ADPLRRPGSRAAQPRRFRPSTVPLSFSSFLTWARRPFFAVSQLYTFAPGHAVLTTFLWPEIRLRFLLPILTLPLAGRLFWWKRHAMSFAREFFMAFVGLALVNVPISETPMALLLT